MLSVNGVEMINLDRYAIRFVAQTDGTALPVLYHDGKRVTKAWRLVLDVTTEEDASGGNANTAG